ncbi:MAG: DNA repair protein RecO [Bacteroidia bacterium]
MLTKVKGIVISKVNFNDNSVIAKIYTNVFGLQSYIVNGVKNNKGVVKQSHLLTLNLLELDVYHQQNKNLQRIKEIKCFPLLINLHADMVKSSIAVFMSELIYKSIKHENIPDENLFSFLYQSILYVENSKNTLSHFHLWFMLHYSSFLGFEPKPNFSDNKQYFSLIDGYFVEAEGLNTCRAETSKQIFNLITVEAKNLHELMFTENQRIKIYEALLKYFELHEIALGTINSYKILKQVFGKIWK